MFSIFINFATGNFTHDATIVYHDGKFQYLLSDGVCMCELDQVVDASPSRAIRLPISHDANRILQHTKGLTLKDLAPVKNALLVDGRCEWAYEEKDVDGLLTQSSGSFACRDIVLPVGILCAHKPDWFNVYPKCTRLVNHNDNYKHFVEVPYDVKLRNEKKVNLDEAIFGVHVNPLYLWDFVRLFNKDEMITIHLSLDGPLHVTVKGVLHFYMAPIAHE